MVSNRFCNLRAEGPGWWEEDLAIRADRRPQKVWICCRYNITFVPVEEILVKPCITKRRQDKGMHSLSSVSLSITMDLPTQKKIIITLSGIATGFTS